MTSRFSFLMVAGLASALTFSVLTEAATAGGWHRAYGRGYYAGNSVSYGYSTGYRGDAYGATYTPAYSSYPNAGWGYGAGYGGWAADVPYYHHGSLYRGGYLPSYSYGLYNPPGNSAPVGYSPSSAPYGYSNVGAGYDYAPYASQPVSGINTVPYGAGYGVPASKCNCR